MADLTFKANLLPNTDLGKALGSENQRWNIYGKFAHTPNNTTTFLRGDNTFSNILTGNIYTKGYYMDQANPDSTETHKANIHLWGDVVAFTYRNSDNTYLGDAFYYNINNGDITAKHEVYITNGNLSVGTAEETTNQRRITLNSGSGDLILFSNASATGYRGLWVNAHGTGAGKNIILIDTNNNAAFTGNADTATKLSNTPNNTTTFLRGDNTWTNKLNNSLHLYAQTYGNTTTDMKSGVAGLFSWGDKGPQITFDTTQNPGDAQAGALIYTDNDAAGTGVSWHFVSNQPDWNVNSKRFVAKTSVTIGENLPNTSYNFYLNGSGYLNNGYFYIGAGGGLLNGAATNGGINSIRMGDDVWLGDCNASGIMGMKSTGTNCGFYFYNNNGTQIGQLYANGSNIISNKSLQFNSGNGVGIYYSGTKANYRMIRFIDNTGDTYGNGISIGGGGPTIIGGGESANAAADALGTGGSEVMYICNDGAIEFFPNLQNGWTTSYRNWIDTSGYYHGIKVYGAVWNDYAEYRKDNPEEKQAPGKCVREVGDGTLILTTKRLERGCEIISDTFGFAIGQDEENGYNTPIASNGRVLAYPYESIEEFSKHIGWPVCSGPDGTVSIMTEEEEEKYPSRIIGTISEIPTYKEWGTGKVKVNGRIWIRIR